MRFSLLTKGFTDIIDITEKVSEIIERSGVKEGICLIFSPGSTCGITTIEYEEGLKKDLKRILDKLIPPSEDYEHCKKWGDCNGFSHIRSSFLRPSLVVPIEGGKLSLGTWQQIVFIDFDKRSRKREVIVKVISERNEGK